ncbi:hypothetical protein RB195_006847 [Necator americanus]|uniref:SCP domain-containing protein n=1 Tax=Necator americanus TaxID=51031 RepID=A0ABR1BUJ7_NECAM
MTLEKRLLRWCQEGLGCRKYLGYRNGKGLGWRSSYNARTVAELAIEDVMMHAWRIKYDDIGPTGARRRNSINAAQGTGEEVFSETCDSRGFGGVDAFCNTNTAENIDPFRESSPRKCCQNASIPENFHRSRSHFYAFTVGVSRVEVIHHDVGEGVSRERHKLPRAVFF